VEGAVKVSLRESGMLFEPGALEKPSRLSNNVNFVLVENGRSNILTELL
jgi:hypothetical protein